MNNEMNKNYLSWDETFLALCKLVSLRSKDKFRKTGSCIVDSKNRIMGLGYNGLPLGCNDNLFPKDNNENVYNDKDTYMIPSIVNAILLSRRNLEGCSLYTTDFPSADETKMIIQNGLSKIYYINENDTSKDDYIASIRMLDASNVVYKKLSDLKVNCSDKELITWDEAFIGLSKIVAMRSKDPNTQVGACIVDDKNRIISLGYNGLPFGCDDKCFPWGRDSKNIVDTKYPYVVHAEVNAISIAQSTSPRDLSNSKIYLSLFPCNNCAAKLIQAGVSEILYVLDKYADTDAYKASKRMLNEAGVTYRMIDDVDVTVEGYNKIIKR